MTKELYQLPAMGAPLPVSKDAPDEEPLEVKVPLMLVGDSLAIDEGEEAGQYTTLTRRALMVVADSRTLLVQRTGATMANPRCIQHAQRAIALWSPLLWIERMISRTPQRPVWLRKKSGTGNASRKRRAGEFRRSIRHRRRGLRDGSRLDERLRLIHLGRSKFRCAHGRGMQRMPKFQA